MTNLKEKLHALCRSYAQERITNAQHGIDEARASQANETKSSAGDKYETGRAMAQQEIDRNTTLLAEARQLLNALDKIIVNTNTATVVPGSIVITDKANFYIAISTGSLTVDNKKYFAISPASPIGLKLAGKKKGDKLEINGNHYTIKEVQ